MVEKLKKACELSFLASLLVLPFSKALLEITLAVTFISWFVYKLKQGSFAADKTQVFTLFGLLMIFSSVSAFDSGYPLVALRGMLKLLKFILAAFVAIELSRNPKWLKQLFVVALVAYTILISDSVAQLIFGKDLIADIPYQYTDLQIRLTGPFISYGLLAAFLIAILPIMVVFAFSKNNLSRFQRLLFFILTAASFFLLYKTHSRGAWIASVISWATFSYLVRKRIVWVLLVTLLILVPLVLPYNTLVHLDRERKEQSLVERYHLWNRAIQVIQARPLFGCGINTFTRNYTKFDKTKSWRVPGYPVHNGFLQLAAESGLISLLLFLAIIGMAVRFGWKGFQNSSGEKKLLAMGLLTGFIALLCQGVIDTTFHNIQSGVLLWFYIGLLLSIKDWNMS